MTKKQSNYFSCVTFIILAFPIVFRCTFVFLCVCYKRIGIVRGVFTFRRCSKRRKYSSITSSNPLIDHSLGVETEGFKSCKLSLHSSLLVLFIFIYFCRFVLYNNFFVKEQN